MPYPLCRHIKTNGLQCKAPALTGAPLCYFHQRLHQRHSAFRNLHPAASNPVAGQTIDLAPIEDRDAVQVALSVVINALAQGQLDTRRATALLYGLQLASNNASGSRTGPPPAELVRSVESTPEGLDLAAPGALLYIDPYLTPSDI